MVLFKKEFQQYQKEMKLIWLPILCIFIGLSQPIMLHFLPDILASMGGSEGLVIQTTTQTGNEVLANVIGAQFDQLGLIVIVMTFMGLVLAEKENGMLDFILTRPVSATSYIASKWLASFSFLIVSLLIGFMASVYYTDIYFSAVDLGLALSAILCYLLWIGFVMCLVLMCSTLLNSQGVVALVSLAVAFLLKVLTGLHLPINRFNPASLSTQAANKLLTGETSTDLIWQVMATFVLSFVLIYVSIKWIQKKNYQLKS
ncbi:ABC transporter permease [Isobaculum melis]|nr:ABC transporter permease subunit [Isobaculum melis]